MAIGLARDAAERSRATANFGPVLSDVQCNLIEASSVVATPPPPPGKEEVRQNAGNDDRRYKGP